jgi:hypothetical protein
MYPNKTAFSDMNKAFVFCFVFGGFLGHDQWVNAFGTHPERATQ